MRKLLTMLMLGAAVFAFTGCGDQSTEEVATDAFEEMREDAKTAKDLSIWEEEVIARSGIVPDLELTPSQRERLVGVYAHLFSANEADRVIYWVSHPLEDEIAQVALEASLERTSSLEKLLEASEVPDTSEVNIPESREAIEAIMTSMAPEIKGKKRQIMVAWAQIVLHELYVKHPSYRRYIEGKLECPVGKALVEKLPLYLGYIEHGGEFPSD